MFFSVIVPVYNVKSYLRQCIESILMQSCTDMELLLVDDGSTDGSGTICDEYSKKDIRVKVIHKKNGGVSDARNQGLYAAKGKYIIFVDADDYWETDILSSIKEKIVSTGEPDLIFTNNEYRELPNGKKNIFTCGFSSNDFDSLNGEATLEYLLTKTDYNLFSVWRGIFKTSVIKNNKILFEKGVTVGEDADWLFRFILCTRNNILFETPFYVYRVNRIGSAMSTKSKKALSSYLSIVKKWIDINSKSPSNIGEIICSKLSNNYVEYFKYIFFYEKEFREKLIYEINKSNLLSYVNSPYGIKIKYKIQKKGFNKILKNLNRKWKAKQKIKNILVKLRLINR